MSAQLQQAIINAHNAGDVEAAKRLGQMLKTQSQGTAQAPHRQPNTQQQAASVRIPPHRRNQPKPGADNAFQYGIDQAQSLGGGLIEGIGKKANSPSIQKYGQDVQKQQEKDMAEGGYQFEYDSFRDAYEKKGLSGAISHGGSAVAAGIPTTGATLIGGGATALAATYGAPAWAIATLGAATTAAGVGLGIGESVLEQKEKTGNFNADLAIGVGVVSGALDRLGVRKLFNLKQLKEMTADQIAEVLRKKGMGVKAKEFLKGIGIEGITETAQEATQIASTAAVGGQYEGQEVQDRLTDAFITGGLMSATIKTGTGTVQSATNLVRGNSKNIKNEGDTAAAASLAGRLNTIATANSYDLKDIDKMSTKGARETLDKAHVQYTEELKQKFADLKSRVKITDQDTLAEVSDKIMTTAAYREGRNKTKNTVGKQEMAALEKLTGDTREGQEAMSILRQLNQLTEVHNNGYQGGVSQVTDQFAPFGAASGYDKGAVATERLLRPLVSGSAAISTGGGSLLAQLAAQGTGRAIDKVTGKRSKVATYVKKNSGNQGIPGSNATSLRETNIENMEAATAEEESSRLRQEQLAQESRKADLDLARENAPPNPESPQGIFELGTALDRSGIAQVLRVIKRTADSEVSRWIQAYETSVATGGQVDYRLVRKINGFVDSNPVYKGLMGNRVRNQGVVQGAVQQQLSQKEQNYERGRKDNLAEAARITEAINADGTIKNVIHKALLLNTLEKMQLNLGKNPVATLQKMAIRLEEKGVPSETVEKYLGQYLQRVMAQQGAKAELAVAKDAALEAVSTDQNPLNIERDANLKPEFKVIEKRFSEQLNSDPEKAIREYNALPDSDGGRIVSADTARELSSDYRASRAVSSAVQEPSSALAKEVYRRLLQNKAPKGKDNNVLFTAGGTGAGKSTALNDALAVPQKRAQIIYDSNVSGLESGIKKIDQATAAGKKVMVAYVYRDPIDALRGAIKRAIRMGRTVPIDVHVATHVNSNRVLKELARHYASDGRVGLNVIDNSRGPGEAVNLGKDLSILPDYDYNQLLEEAINELTKARAQGLSQEIYDGFNANKTIR